MTTTLERFRGLIDQNATGDSPVLAEELIRTLDLNLEQADDLSIAGVAELLDISADTLRYYEKAGLVRALAVVDYKINSYSRESSCL
ncbi:MAG: MerR family DNA-binding transcriptional regulator [Microlunatus sp.]|nr:MerR family DNA-binding transcriptional regulator [Microlunatus sp.]